MYCHTLPLNDAIPRCNEGVQPAGQGTPGVGGSRRVRSRGVGYDATCLTEKEEPMARKPNYDFERKERERLKAEKKATRAAEKKEAAEKQEEAAEKSRQSESQEQDRQHNPGSTTGRASRAQALTRAPVRGHPEH